MSDEPVISIASVSKAYRIWESPASRLTAPLLASAATIFPGALGQGLKERAGRSYRDFWALKNISFEVKKGESVGIIGRNGSGKSTLLQIIAGTMQPTEGSVRVKGRVAALLELGSGFNPEFTGRENVYLNGAVLGLARREIDRRFDEITAFADIGDFIDQPVKTYSSGMLMRLAFAVQTAVNPDILIVDEALSVGDFFFQQKCFQRIKELRTRGTTILIVSHDTASVRDLCSRVLYLKHGRGVYFGDAQSAISLYLRDQDSPPGVAAPVTANDEGRTPRTTAGFLQEISGGALWVNPEPDRLPPAEIAAQVIAVRMLDALRQPSTKLQMGQRAIIQVYLLAHSPAGVHVAVEIKNRHGQIVSSIGSRVAGLNPLPVDSGQIWELEADIELALESGEYSLQAVIGLPDSRPNVGTRVHSTPWLGPFTIHWDYEQEPAPFLGMFNLPTRLKFTPCNPVDTRGRSAATLNPPAQR